MSFPNLEALQKSYSHYGKKGGWYDFDGSISIDASQPKYKDEIRSYLALKQTLNHNSGGQSPSTGVPNNSSNKRRTHTSRDEWNRRNMPRPTKRSQAWKGRKPPQRRRRPPQNKALRSHKIPFKKVIPLDTLQGSTETGIYFNSFSLKELATPVMAVYEEFRCASLKLRFIPEDVTTGSGLYAVILLDQGGFGKPATGAATWFPRVADMPGARVCHVTRGFKVSWRPTEPDSRNFKKVVGGETDYVTSTLYVFGSTASTRVHGQLIITGALLVRGEYYTASITSRLSQLHLMDGQGSSSHSEAESDEEEERSIVKL